MEKATEVGEGLGGGQEVGAKGGEERGEGELGQTGGADLISACEPCSMGTDQMAKRCTHLHAITDGENLIQKGRMGSDTA